MKRFISRLIVAILVIIVCNIHTPFFTPVLENAQAANAAAIKLNQTKLSLRINEKYKLILDGNKAKVKWSSNNQVIAKVSKSGIVTGIKPGYAVITATVGSKQYKCKVTVLSPRLKSNQLLLNYGVSLQLEIINLPVKYIPNEVVYVSDNETVVSVDEDGVITALNQGCANIYITYGTYKFKCMVEVMFSVRHIADSLEVEYKECGEMILCFIKNKNNFDFDISCDLDFYNKDNDLVSSSSGYTFIGNIRTIYANDESVYFFEKSKEEYSYCKLHVDNITPSPSNVISKDKVEVKLSEPYDYTYDYKDSYLSDYQSDTIKLFDLNVNNLSDRKAILWAVVVLYNGDEPVDFIVFIKGLDIGLNIVKNPLLSINNNSKLIMPAYDSYKIFYSINSY